MVVCCVMAKAPVAGAVKTRLVPPLTVEQAATMASGFLLDTWASAKEAFGDSVVLSYAGDRSRFPAPLESVPSTPQRGGDLGSRIESAIEAALERGDRAIIVGSDLPCLPPAALREAAGLLETADACLGPSADGGYYLIGARRWQSGLLEGLPWSSPDTLTATRARLAERGYAVAMAAPFDDIDEPADLERVRLELAEDPSRAPRTAAAFELIGL